MGVLGRDGPVPRGTARRGGRAGNGQAPRHGGAGGLSWGPAAGGVRPRVTAWTRPARWASGSVAVVVRLVGAFDLHADVLGLLGTERRELHAERVEVQAGDLLRSEERRVGKERRGRWVHA